MDHHNSPSLGKVFDKGQTQALTKEQVITQLNLEHHFEGGIFVKHLKPNTGAK